ncbi:MAG: hypothetical protein ACRD3R_06850 [Terriglobales bacterium]
MSDIYDRAVEAVKRIADRIELALPDHHKRARAANALRRWGRSMQLLLWLALALMLLALFANCQGYCGPAVAGVAP